MCVRRYYDVESERFDIFHVRNVRLGGGTCVTRRPQSQTIIKLLYHNIGDTVLHAETSYTALDDGYEFAPGPHTIHHLIECGVRGILRV